jgi:hypothetical protein
MMGSHLQLGETYLCLVRTKPWPQLAADFDFIILQNGVSTKAADLDPAWQCLPIRQNYSICIKGQLFVLIIGRVFGRAYH